MQTFLLVILLILFTLCLSAHSFVPPVLSTKKDGAFVLQSSFYSPEESFSDHNDNDDEHSFNIEEARKQLEALVGDSSSQQQSSVAASPVIEKKQTTALPWRQSPRRDVIEINLPEAPPLTLMDRERRLTELELLKHLAEGDKAIAALWEFWFQERGIQAASRLYNAVALSEQRDTWEKAEELLLDLIDTHGVHWAEPVNRLATLYYMQGRWDDAEVLCLTVLKVKPWHFGALSGIVLVYAAMNAPDKARQYAALRLPGTSPQGSTRRRIEWTNRATEQATDALWNAEQRLADRFGPMDGHAVSSTPILLKDANNEFDAWQ